MNEEEKKAIAYLKFYIERDVMYENTHYEQIKTILNLIEKQSKEIEELKEKDNANLAYYDQIYQNGIYTGQKAVEYKIKAKIEELDIQEKEVLKGTKGQDRYAIKQEYMHKRSALQSLLEKE